MAAEPASASSLRSRVQILDPIVANQIAAGEVVERPASVVKELVENALDAGAQEITVLLANGGVSAIEVRDDGCGMDADDARRALQRFGTSKVRSAEDLLSVATLGFRGEALPSIISVSEFSLTTAAQDGAGTEISGAAGVVAAERAIRCSVGTRVCVERLFYNVPARKKFLRSERTETGVVRTLLQDVSLAHPKVRLCLIADGVELLRLSPVESLRARAKELKLAGEKALDVDYEQAGVRVQAVLSQPVEAVPHANRLRLIVNGRIVRDKLLLRAVRDGYGNYLKGGCYPQGVLTLELPAQDVDVNVHPQKAEVRFRQSSRVFSAIVVALGRALKKDGSLPEALKSWELSLTLQEPDLSAPRLFRAPQPVEFFGSKPVDATESKEAWSRLSDAATDSPQLSTFRYVGQFFRCYLVLERDEHMALVDMHAAHERVMFFRLKEQFLSHGISTQLLLIPEVLPLPLERAEQFQQAQPHLQRLGIEIEAFGEDSVLVRAMPALLQRCDPRRLVEDLLSMPEWANWSSAVQDVWDQALSRVACHASIRSGRELEAEEVFHLLLDLEAAEASGYCPHGRPTVRIFSKPEVERMFGRIL